MGTDILPITGDMLVGKLRKELSYQFAAECANRTQRLHETGVVARQIKERTRKMYKNMRFLCEIPAREYYRIQQQVDRDFFRDRKNINRFLLQDHPELKGGTGI